MATNRNNSGTTTIFLSATWLGHQNRAVRDHLQMTYSDQAGAVRKDATSSAKSDVRKERGSYETNTLVGDCLMNVLRSRTTHKPHCDKSKY